MEDKNNDAEEIYNKLIKEENIKESDYNRILKCFNKEINYIIANYSNNTLMNCKLLIQIIKRFHGYLSEDQELMKLLFEKYKTEFIEYIKKIEKKRKNSIEINNQAKKEENKNIFLKIKSKDY